MPGPFSGALDVVRQATAQPGGRLASRGSSWTDAPSRGATRPRPPSVEDEFAAIVQTLPDEMEFDQEQVAGLVEMARKSYEAKLKNQQSGINAATARPFNEHQAAESGLRQQRLQQGMDIQAGRLHPELRPEEKQILDYRVLRGGALAHQATQNLDQDAELHPYQVQRAQDQVRFGQETHDRRGEMHDLGVRRLNLTNEGLADTNDVRMGRAFPELSPQEQRMRDFKEQEAQRQAELAGEKVTTEREGRAKPPAPKSGGGAAKPEIPYEQQEDDYVFKEMEKLREGGVLPAIEEANKNAASVPFWPDREATPAEAVMLAERQYEDKFRKQFRQRFPRQQEAGSQQMILEMRRELEEIDAELGGGR